MIYISIISIVLWFCSNISLLFYDLSNISFSIVLGYFSDFQLYFNYICYFLFQETMKCLLLWESLLCAVVNSIQVQPLQRVPSQGHPRCQPRPCPQTGVHPRVARPQLGVRPRGGGPVKTPRPKSGNLPLKSDLKVLLFLQVCYVFLIT